MEKYNHHLRQHSFHWNCIQIESFLKNAIEKESTSYISYAALEGRIAIERIEYELLVIGTQKHLSDEWMNLISGYKGIDKANNKYKSLKFKVQTFTEAFAKTFTEFPLKAFDFRMASDYESKLADYIHLYYRCENDLKFESDFMQKGIDLIKELIDFLKNLFMEFQNNYIFGVVDIRSLMNGAVEVFKDWLNNKSTDTSIIENELSSLKISARGSDIVSVKKCII